MDFVRLMVVFALTYLKLLAATCLTAKVTCLATRYWPLFVSHTQVLLHGLTPWKEEHPPRGGGLVDYAKTLHHSRVTSFHDDADEGEAAAEAGGAKDERRRVRRGMQCVSQRHYTLELVEATCRYYFTCLAVT
ncbi:hypothetical protein JIQ42_02669 [Leishmania sp. Namibia]|uniref:hypothetical protein n=1 Tax=Leishmania sp. Namibia TaxID=2802991 RepID=UPI001B5174A0|nr:hypothetical protein JIQ42_02669 [Leishmania sp. Namibia]